MNKKKLYQELASALVPEFTNILYGTTNGFRWCKNDPLTVDYDYVYAIKLSDNDKDNIFISDFTQNSGRIIMQIEEFYAVYNYGDSFSVIESASPSYKDCLTAAGQTKLKQYFSAINSAFAAALKP